MRVSHQYVAKSGVSDDLWPRDLDLVHSRSAAVDDRGAGQQKAHTVKAHHEVCHIAPEKE